MTDKEKTEDLKTEDLMTWSDLETLSSDCSHETDPERLFDRGPQETDQKRSDLIDLDPENIGLFLSHGSKINRLTKRSDKRLSCLRSGLSLYIEYMERMT